MIFLTALFPGWMMNELIAYIFIDFKTIRFWCTSLYLFSIFSNAHRVKSMTTVLWNGYSRLRLNFWKGLPKTQTSTLLKICEVGLKTGYFQGNQPINFTNSAKKSCQISSQSYTRNCFFGGFSLFYQKLVDGYPKVEVQVTKEHFTKYWRCTCFCCTMCSPCWWTIASHFNHRQSLTPSSIGSTPAEQKDNFVREIKC